MYLQKPETLALTKDRSKLTWNGELQITRFKQLRGNVLKVERGQLWQLLLNLAKNAVVNIPCPIQVARLSIA